MQPPDSIDAGYFAPNLKGSLGPSDLSWTGFVVCSFINSQAGSKKMSDLKHIFSMILISSVFGVAHAAVSPPVGAGSVSLAVTVKLFDLAPEDGITPYISFLDGYTQTTSSSELGR